MNKQIEELNKRFETEDSENVLKYFLNKFDGKIALASSLSVEDQVLTDMIIRLKPNAYIFTLDTGRLFPESYSLIEETNHKYNIRIRIFFPDSSQVEKMVNNEGINLFYTSVENRKKCCSIRKIEPLKRAFAGMKVWICGLRKEQSVTRNNIKLIEWDEMNALIKINPLINFTEEQLWQYIQKYKVPYNPLHDKNFPSIGCEPCTREVKEGEDIRAGRWWWESPIHKECGLHRRK